jgi:hypothetical protein
MPGRIEILEAIAAQCEAIRLLFSSGMALSGKDGFYGEDAEALVYAAAAAAHLPRDIVDAHFPFATYFEPETKLSAWPFSWFGSRQDAKTTSPALPASGLADLLDELALKPSGPASQREGPN